MNNKKVKVIRKLCRQTSQPKEKWLRYVWKDGKSNARKEGAMGTIIRDPTCTRGRIQAVKRAEGHPL